MSGVKQGGGYRSFDLMFLLNFLNRLEDTGVGCHMRSRFSGANDYADDNTLLALCKLALMVKVCESYASEYDISFNGIK